MRAAGRRGFYLRCEVCVSAAASRLLSFSLCGVWSRFLLTIASPDTSFCQSQPGQMPARSEHTDTHLLRRAGRSVAALRLWWMRRRWLTERRRGEQLVCAHTRPATVSQSITACLKSQPGLNHQCDFQLYSCVCVPCEMIRKHIFTCMSADY